MVEYISVVVNVMLYLMGVMSPLPAECYLSARTMLRLCTLSMFALGLSLVSWIVMIYACVSWISSLRFSNLFLIPFMLTCSMIGIYLNSTAGSVSLWCVCSQVVVFGLSVRFSWYPMWMWWLLWLCWVYYCLWYMCLCWESMRVRGWRQCWCGWWMRCGCGECRACGWYMWFRYSVV